MKFVIESLPDVDVRPGRKKSKKFTWSTSKLGEQRGGLTLGGLEFGGSALRLYELVLGP